MAFHLLAYTRQISRAVESQTAGYIYRELVSEEFYYSREDMSYRIVKVGIDRTELDFGISGNSI